MKQRYRAPILWSALGVVVVLAYVLSRPVPIPIDSYRPPEAPVTAAVEATPAGAGDTAPVALAAAGAGEAATTATPEPATLAPAPLAAPETPAPAPPVVADPAPAVELLYVAATSLNLRAAPAAGAAVLELLPRGTPVEAVGAAGAVEGWREVVNPATGMRGWMSAEYLSATPPAGTTTPAPTATAPAPAATLTPGFPTTPAAAPGLVLVP